MAKSLFGYISNHRTIGGPHLRHAKAAGVTASRQDIRREADWRRTVTHPDVLARRAAHEAELTMREKVAQDAGHQVLQHETEADKDDDAERPVAAELGQKAVYGSVDEGHETILI